jgi:hypothetical protein
MVTLYAGNDEALDPNTVWKRFVIVCDHILGKKNIHPIVGLAAVSSCRLTMNHLFTGGRNRAAKKFKLAYSTRSLKPFGLPQWCKLQTTSILSTS